MGCFGVCFIQKRLDLSDPYLFVKMEVDSGKKPGVTSDAAAKIKELERENRELKQANEILRKASAFFAQAELDRKPRK